MTLLEKIKAELKKRGLPETLSDFLKIEKDEEIEPAINALAGVGKVDSLKDAFAKNPSLKAEFDNQVQSDFDKKIDQALKKNENTLKEKFDFIEKGKQASSIPEIEELKKTIGELGAIVKGFTEGQSKEQLKTRFMEKAKEKKIPEKFANRYMVESADKLDETLGIAEKEYTEIRQQMLVEQFGEDGIPKSAALGSTVIESQAADYAKSKNTSAVSDTGIVGKKL